MLALIGSILKGVRHMQKRIWQSGLSILAAAALVAGCGTNNSSSGTTNTSNSGGTGNTTSTSGKTIKVGLVTDTGGLNDNSFNHLAYVGMQEAQKDLPNIQTSVVQSQSESDYVPNLSHFAQDGYNLVIAVGYLMADAVQQVAKEYPKTHFLIIDDSITGIPNVASAIFQSQQAGYLAGVVAGMVQRNHLLKNINSHNTVGVVGGQEIPPVDTYIAGFQQGFHSVDPTGKVIVEYTNSFNDEAAGSQYAQNEISQGADIIFPVAGGTGIGSIKAAQSAKVYAVGVDTDQSYLAPGTVITSAIKRVDTSVFDTIKAVQDGTFKSGVNNFDLSNNGVGIAPIISGLPKSVTDAVNQAKQEILSGKIQVSTTVQK